MKKNKYILGIETSCDDTSIAIIKKSEKIEVLKHLNFGQEEILSYWGGVVPEIAARNHLSKITPMLEMSFKESEISPADIDVIAVTTHPGLLGPLLTGINAAKSLSLLFKKPILPVNHLYAHIQAIHLSQEIAFPFMGLLISGGHSLFLWVTGTNQFEVIGGTIDDACGEAFDKAGKMLGLGYPAGHLIDKLATFGSSSKYEFPIGLKSSADSNLSFSGVKTSLRVFIEKNPTLIEKVPTQFDTAEKAYQDFYDVCASYQEAIVKALLLKSKYALKNIQDKYNPKSKIPIIIGGGVAANSRIRELFKQKYPQRIFCVEKEYCTDNAAMIANYAALNLEDAIAYPQCLQLDAKSRFQEKRI